MQKAPEFTVTKWLNTDQNLYLENFRGKVVCAFAFQMLCPGCVQYLVPQAKKVHALFGNHEVAVLGLHTVFEHHDAMREPSLRAFIHEYGLTFPIGIDAQPEGSAEGMPETMRTYQMRGTPTTLLIDGKGMLKKNAFGHIDDMQLGAEIMNLLMEETESRQ